MIAKSACLAFYREREAAKRARRQQRQGGGGEEEWDLAADVEHDATSDADGADGLASLLRIIERHTPSDSSSPQANFLPGFEALRLLLLKEKRSPREIDLLNTVLACYDSYKTIGRSEADTACMTARDYMLLGKESSTASQVDQHACSTTADIWSKSGTATTSTTTTGPLGNVAQSQQQQQHQACNNGFSSLDLAISLPQSGSTVWPAAQATDTASAHHDHPARNNKVMIALDGSTNDISIDELEAEEAFTVPLDQDIVVQQQTQQQQQQQQEPDEVTKKKTIGRWIRPVTVAMLSFLVLVPEFGPRLDTSVQQMEWEQWTTLIISWTTSWIIVGGIAMLAVSALSGAGSIVAQKGKDVARRRRETPPLRLVDQDPAGTDQGPATRSRGLFVSPIWPS
jgi:hypothetical protein